MNWKAPKKRVRGLNSLLLVDVVLVLLSLVLIQHMVRPSSAHDRPKPQVKVEKPTTDGATPTALKVESKECPVVECPQTNIEGKECPMVECPQTNIEGKECPTQECPTQECPTQECPTQECPTQECPTQECPTQECPVQVAEKTKLSPAEYEKVQKEIAETSARFELALAKHIQKKRIEVVKGTRSIILRIPIKVAFQKKKPRFRKSYAKVMRVLRKILEPSTYPIIAGCHTAEDLPPGKHRSHWTYSSACAGQLARSILRQDIVRPDRVQAHGYGNTRQLHPGAKGRKASQNLRMELELVFIP